MSDTQAKTDMDHGGATPSTPPPLNDHDRAVNFAADQLAPVLAKAGLATSMYGKSAEKDVDIITQSLAANPGLQAHLDVPADKVTSVKDHADYTRVSMTIGGHQEIVGMSDKQLTTLAQMNNVTAEQALDPSTKQHPLANHPDVIGAIQQARAALNNTETSTPNPTAQAPARGNGMGR